MFFDKSSLVYCNNIVGLIQSIDLDDNPTESILFIDSSSGSLKVVHLYNGNSCSTIPIGHLVEMKEIHNSMDHLLSAVNYQELKWLICGDLKVVWLTSRWVHKSILIFCISGTTGLTTNIISDKCGRKRVLSLQRMETVYSKPSWKAYRKKEKMVKFCRIIFDNICRKLREIFMANQERRMNWKEEKGGKNKKEKNKVIEGCFGTEVK